MKVGYGIGDLAMLASMLFLNYQNDLVVGLPKLSFDLDKVCDACVKEKHKKSF